MNERNPLQDPEIGDVVRKGAITRTVLSCECVYGPIQVSYKTAQRKYGGCCWLKAWRAWCRGAEVVKRGDA